MRALIVLAVLALAAPAAAQDLHAIQRDNEIRAEQDLARQRSIDQSNQLMSLDAQVRSDQAVRQLEAQRQRPLLPAPAVRPDAAPQPSPGAYVSIPDDRLATSNAAVKAASESKP